MKEIKELLKPPFNKYQIYGTYRINTGDDHIVLHGGEYTSRTALKSIAKWVCDAMNEKWERDFEPKRVIVKESAEGFARGYCPDCHTEVWNTVCVYCYMCGCKFSKPEEK